MPQIFYKHFSLSYGCKAFVVVFVCMLLNNCIWGQNQINIEAKLDDKSNSIAIKQTITYFNDSNDILDIIYLNDWNNSYSTKKTPLAERFAEEYDNSFHFAKDDERGYTQIESIEQKDGAALEFSYLNDFPDIIKVKLNTPLQPNSSYTIALNYTIKIAHDKFTRYGITDDGNYNLRYWYITPTMYNGSWQYYSNKNLDDLYIPKSNITINLTLPNTYNFASDLNSNIIANNEKQLINLSGKDRVDSKLFITKHSNFKTVETDYFSIVSDITEDDLQEFDKAFITDKIAAFITNNLGAYPHEKLLVSSIDNKKDPIYGLNQLPSFIRPFPDNFQYELKLLKATLNNYLEQVLLINPRKDQWLKDGLLVYFLMKYIEDFYPDMKLLGSFANFWGVRTFHAADLNFNEQYTLGYMHMARTNRDQPITMAKDSLLKFNKNIANKYKAGVGFKYLDDFINENTLENTIIEFLKVNKLKTTNGKEFEKFLKSKTDKNIDWFFKDYLGSRKKIDFKIKNVTKSKDSVTLTIKNKRNNSMPVSLFMLNNDSIIKKLWVEDVKDEKTISLKKEGVNKLVLNYDRSIPEYNLRDNWKSLKGFFFNNKPLQFRVFKDFEDPNYNQVFLMPLVEFKNIYDGLTFGTTLYNKTVLRKAFNYKFAPQYATKSRSLTGSGTIFHIRNIEGKNLYNITYGINASYRSYAEDLFVRKITPSISFRFRDKDDFRSNKFQSFLIRYIDIHRDEDVNSLEDSEPNYGVFNMRYVNSNDNLINFSKWFTDVQIADNFTKAAFNYEYRRLFESNRQINLRFYAGAFLYNDTSSTTNYFSFALDRPTDYMFDYNYLGRSENSGIFSQQLIIAEGGFKSKLETPFANQWITTLNASTTIWKYIQAYGDIGYVKNKYHSPKFVYDSGIRLNLVTDYFEIYFPVYSNLGWEIAQDNYDQKIRFVFTVDPQSLLGLFRRKWY